jgi:hypothetical protein
MLNFMLLSQFYFKCIPAEVTDKQLKNNDDFVWAIDVPLTTGKFIIDVEFLDLKAASPGVCFYIGWPINRKKNYILENTRDGNAPVI